MHLNDVEKIAFHMPQGLFAFLVMPFGITNAMATSQALMNEVFTTTFDGLCLSSLMTY